MKEKCLELLLLSLLLIKQTIFEQTITGVFSSVNTRIAFDTEILLPNLINKEETERSKSGKSEEIRKDYNHKICYNIRLNNEKEYSKKEL